MNSQSWQVYILECNDKTWYCGVTKDLGRRLKQHNSGKGSKYTRARLPCWLRRASVLMTHSEALKLEIKIKKLPRDKKLEALL